MKIAIHENINIFNHSSSWTGEWIRYCQENNIPYEVVDCYDNNILEKLKPFDVLLWHFSHYSLQDMMFARSILTCVKSLGLHVFPDFDTSWHFDDKIAETYLLESINAPIPKNWKFYTRESALDFIKGDCLFPIVAKLKSGSGSHNVKLLKNKSEAKKYVNTMFKAGFRASPSFVFKAKSNLQSSKNINIALNRIKRLPDFLETLSKSKQLPQERGYVFFQEYIPNDGYDLKVVVIGDKLSFLARDVRKGDFRASGGGAINYNIDLISSEIRNIAFNIAKRLNFQSMGFDFVIDNRNNSPKIVEISYGFSHTAQMDLGGYWDFEGVWNDIPLNAPIEILNNIIITI